MMKQTTPWDCLLEYSMGKHQHGMIVEVLVYEKCLDLGYNYQFRPDGTVYDCKINGHRVEVKGAAACHTYYSFALTKRQKTAVDFMVCHVWPTNTFYVVPNSGSGLYIMGARYAQHRPPNPQHEGYKEAWHLLK